MTFRIGKALRLLSAKHRRQICLLFASLLAAAALEMIGIGAVPAFVAMLAEPKILLSMETVWPFSVVGHLEPLQVILAGALLLCLIFLAKNVFLGGVLYLQERLARDLTRTISTRLFRTYVLSPYSFHLQTNPAELVRNVTSDVSQAVAYIKACLILTREIVLLVAVFGLLFVFDPIVSFAVIVGLGLSTGFFYQKVRVRLRREGERARYHRAEVVRTVNESLGAIKEAKVLGREAFLLAGFDRHASKQQDSEFQQRLIAQAPRLFLEIVALLGIVIIALIFAVQGRSPEEMIPIMALTGVAIVRLVPAFNSIAAQLTAIRFLSGSVDLVEGQLLRLQESLENQHEHGVCQTDFHGTSFALENVYYRYPGSNESAIKGVTLSFEVGEVVAFVGASGAGKSTLVDLLLGLLEPTVGKVLLLGTPPRADGAWQSRIGYVPQDIYLFDESIARNVSFGAESTDEDVWDALELAQLNDFVRSLPKGLETEVGNRGVRLSGGQRQRLGIARALHHKPMLLVLDEATSALDSETEGEVMDAVQHLRREHTIVLVAHRLSTIRKCDRIFFLKDGALADSGTYPELIKRQPEFARMASHYESGRAGNLTRINGISA